MTNPMTKSILAAGTLALAVTFTRVAPAPRAAFASVAPLPDPASTALLPSDDREALAPASGSSLGVRVVPRDDGSDSGDGGEGDDGGNDDDGAEG